MMRITPGGYFRMLRTHTLNRPQDVLILNSVKNTFQSMIDAPPENPSQYRSLGWKGYLMMSFKKLVRRMKGSGTR